MKVIFVLLAIALSSVLSYKQTIAIKGRFLCRDKPAQFVELQLYDDGIIRDTVIVNDVYSDPGGYFYITGMIDTWFYAANARLIINHRCFPHAYEHQDPCTLKFDIEVPLSQIINDPLPKGFWQFAEISLEKQIGGEKVVCP